MRHSICIFGDLFHCILLWFLILSAVFADLPMSLRLNAQIYYKVILPSDNTMLSGGKAPRENK